MLLNLSFNWSIIHAMDTEYCTIIGMYVSGAETLLIRLLALCSYSHARLMIK